jgi:hypothetical protein
VAVVERQVEAIEQCVQADLQLGDRDAKEIRRIAFEIHSIIGNADFMFRVMDDPAVFDHAREAIRVAGRNA